MNIQFFWNGIKSVINRQIRISPFFKFDKCDCGCTDGSGFTFSFFGIFGLSIFK